MVVRKSEDRSVKFPRSIPKTEENDFINKAKNVKNVVFKEEVDKIYIENKQEAKKGNFIHINVEANDPLETNRFPRKSILKEGIRKESGLSWTEVPDDYWYLNWKKDVEISREKTNIWFWFMEAIRYQAVEVLQAGLQLQSYN